MPPKAKHTTSLTKARDTLAEKKALQASESGREDLWNQLQSAHQLIEELEGKLLEKENQCHKLESALATTNKLLAQCKFDRDSLKSKHTQTYHKLRMQRQATKRGQAKLASLEAQMDILREAETRAASKHLTGSRQSNKALVMLNQTNKGLNSELSKSMTKWTTQITKMQSKLDSSDSKIKGLQNQVNLLQKNVTSQRKAKECVIISIKEKIYQEKSVHSLMEKGVFTEETRNVVRLLVKAGCSQNYISEVISAVFKSAGIATTGTISQTSVECILREGYVAAQIQLGHEIQNTPGMTFSADSTTHRSINYDSRHVHLVAEDYQPNTTNPLEDHRDKTYARVTRTFGIESSRDGSSEEAMADWENMLKKIINVYNNSPLAKRSKHGLLTFVNTLIKLMGMNTDHCAKEKKDARLFEELKAWAVNQHLGEEKMLDMSVREIVDYFKAAEEKMIDQVGGKKKWDKLSDFKQRERKAAMLEEAVADLGKEAFTTLSEDEQKIFKLFIWAGCGCHKDLNTVRGGYTELTQWWDSNNIDEADKPVLLANRDNDPVVKEQTATLDEGHTPTPAQERALQSSTRGAIKAAEIAGAILNHKDDKKGHHDVFRYWWWDHVGIDFTFPDTSNNRFQSYCDAAAALILYRDQFIQFLEHLRATKQNSKLNHMETNLWNALHCSATMTELAVLALYTEAVSYPYMESIRDTSAGQQNMLDLGPLHSRVLEHMTNIIEDPNILVGTNSSHLRMDTSH